MGAISLPHEYNKLILKFLQTIFTYKIYLWNLFLSIRFPPFHHIKILDPRLSYDNLKTMYQYHNHDTGIKQTIPAIKSLIITLYYNNVRTKIQNSHSVMRIDFLDHSPTKK